MIQYNGLTLAYIGDAYYELKIREYLLLKNVTKVNALHQNAIKFTSAINQAKAVTYLIDNFYTEKELSIFKRGRNQSATHKPKNTDVQTYNKSTGFEAVIGYLYLANDSTRLNELINYTIEILEKF
ncbi:Mini-ribonuclease 3 [Candidatus Izemoplasma sp. B36]|uniref:Mini-ribonuclease 3 n=1 Tax=Candidatus Izemoplasma sp. B36 TaxID=3242468 RepID=UPI003555CDCA